MVQFQRYRLRRRGQGASQRGQHQASPGQLDGALAKVAHVGIQRLDAGERKHDGADRGDWPGFAWVTAGIVLNALLLTTIGFIFSCALCFVLAVRGFKASEGRLDLRPRAWITDSLIGIAISAPVYWMFTKALAISLPGLTSTGWL